MSLGERRTHCATVGDLSRFDKVHLAGKVGRDLGISRVEDGMEQETPGDGTTM